MEILIVEDDFISRSLLKKMLAEMGHEIIETEDGVQAWDVLQQKRVQLVITDWMMPRMDGLELCQKIRALGDKHYTYIIMLTARDRKTDLVDVFQAGADDYIPKPFDPEELRARVMTGLRVIELEEGHIRLANTLIESRNKVRIVLDSLQEEIVSLDKDLNIVSANQAFAKLLGCPPSEAVGRNCFESLLPGKKTFYSAEVKPMVEEVLASGQAARRLATGRDEKETTTYLQISCLPILDENGGLFQVVVVSQDITEDRRKTEEIKSLNLQLLETTSQVENKNQKLENTLKRLEATQAQMLQSEKMASIGQLAAGVAHEINNPTGFVSSNLKTLTDYQADIGQLLQKYRDLVALLVSDETKNMLSDGILEQIGQLTDYEKEIDLEFLLEDITDLIGDCREGTERIKKIVIDLKDFAHPGEDRIQSTDINSGLESTLNVVNNEIKYKATVHKDFGEIPYISGYPQQLNQVFMNILVNAAQAIDSKGEIHIKTRFQDPDVEIRISDTGCGIAKENLDKIFDPFFTTKDVGKGTGLGMNIAYNIIKKHNGSIDVQSEVGQGTVFTIRLPAAAETDVHEKLQ